MALINCPECKREISDKATSCPNCGFPIGNGGNSDSLEKDDYLNFIHWNEYAKKNKVSKSELDDMVSKGKVKALLESGKMYVEDKTPEQNMGSYNFKVIIVIAIAIGLIATGGIGGTTEVGSAMIVIIIAAIAIGIIRRQHQ